MKTLFEKMSVFKQRVRKVFCNCGHDNLAHEDGGQCYLCECPAYTPLSRQEARDFKTKFAQYETIDRPRSVTLEFDP